MHTARLNLSFAEKKLQRLCILSDVLGENWLAKEYSKPIEQWNLIAGWISLDDMYKNNNWAWVWLKDLDEALGFLKTKVTLDSWKKIVSKLRTHTDRANIKGVLSELALWKFLALNDVPFDLELQLISSSNKDVDITAFSTNKKPLHIEVQWLSPSDVSERGASIATLYDESYPIDFNYEMWRVKQKVYDKTPKFTEGDITFVALDCTTSPEMSGNRFSPIDKVITEAFTGENTQYANSEIDKSIRQLVDGVIWFELEADRGFLPVNRGICVYSKSSNRNEPSISEFIKLWDKDNELKNSS